MAKNAKKLSDAQIRGKMAPKLYSDGDGLYLQVTAADARSWIFRYRIKGHVSSTGKPVSREMGLGSLTKVPLKLAREMAEASRQLIGQGIDPIKHRDERVRAETQRAANAVTFEQAAERYIDSHRAGWKNVKHAGQWKSSLETYAMPILGRMPVREVDTEAVLKVLDPIWSVKTETASRLRGRIELVLDWAKTRGFREGENPARWRGHLDKTLPKPSKVHRVVHHAALPFVALPAFIESASLSSGVGSKALLFTILTAARTGETIGAKFTEFDLSAKLWTIPGARMKAGKDHRVPLSDRAASIVQEMHDAAMGEYVFPGLRKGTHLSDMAMLKQLQRMNHSDITVHGFRSTFRDWASERTNFQSEVVEMALAHVIGNEVEAAYRRGDLFEKRRLLMQAWESYCFSPTVQGATVIQMGKGGA